MRSLLDPEINLWRDRGPRVVKHFGTVGDAEGGRFQFPSVEYYNHMITPITAIPLNAKIHFIVIASTGDGWDHVSISCKNRCPTWDEMVFFKDFFFFKHETCMQLHPAVSSYINYNVNTLHIWRPIDEKLIPLPPLEMV
jgi:hypothetical protein